MADFWIDSYFDPDYFAEGYFGADDTGIVPAELSGTATGGSTASGALSLRLASAPVVFSGPSFRDLLPTPARISATPVGRTNMAPAMRAAATAGGTVMRVTTVGKGFFAKFPNLATQIQAFRNAGMSQVTRSRLYGLLKRFGPELIISGGILTAAAVSELMMAGPGYRRMNPANIHALRRAKRRLESFHRVCMDVDALRRPRSRSCKSKGGSATQFVRQG